MVRIGKDCPVIYDKYQVIFSLFSEQSILKEIMQ